MMYKHYQLHQLSIRITYIFKFSKYYHYNWYQFLFLLNDYVLSKNGKYLNVFEVSS